MGRPLTNLTFEEWVSFVFDHPVDESKLEWYWDMDAEYWDGPPVLTVEYLTRAFENPESVFKPYSDAELKQGLWYLVSNSCSNTMFALLDQSVPWPERRQCIQSFSTLYEKCFAKRCTPHLSHLDEPGSSPLNSVCYMWWDIIPVYGKPKDPSRQELDEEVLQVLESALKLDSVACQESALHGLGHWQYHYPQRVRKIVEDFVKRNSGLREDLRLYAWSASRGHVQ